MTDDRFEKILRSVLAGNTPTVQKVYEDRLYSETSRKIYHLNESFKTAGFSDAEAFDLTKSIISSIFSKKEG